MKQLGILAFLLAAFLASAACAQDQTQNQPAQTQEGVQGWYQQSSGDTRPFTIAFAKTMDSVWTNQHYTTDSGNTWQFYPPGVTVMRFIGGFGYGISPKGSGWISITIDNGQNWNNYTTGFGGNNFYFTTPNRGFCVAQDFIGLTLDGGKTWKLDTTYVGLQISAFTSYDSLHVMAVGQDYFPPAGGTHPKAGIFLTTNGGDSWRYASSVYFNDIGFNNIVFLDSTTIIAIGSTKFILKSTNLGFTWTPCNLGDSLGSPLEGISAPNKNNIVVVGGSGKIFRSNDGGSTWVKQNSGTQNTLYAVSFVDSLTGWAVGDGGLILHTANAGYSWVNPPTSDSLSLTANPNPTNSAINLNYFLPQDQHVTIIMYDIQGNLIDPALTNVFQSQGQQSITIDVHSLPSGMYIIRFQSEQYQSVINCSVIH